MIVGVEQHLVRLLRIDAENEGAAVAGLEVGDLELGSLAGDDRPILGSVALERFAGRVHQTHEDATTGSLPLQLPSGSPASGGAPPAHFVSSLGRNSAVTLGTCDTDISLAISRISSSLDFLVPSSSTLRGVLAGAAWPIGVGHSVRKSRPSVGCPVGPMMKDAFSTVSWPIAMIRSARWIDS